MKKLVFMLALTAGFAAGAGTVNWEFWDDSSTATQDYALYLMEGTLTTGSTIDSITDSATAATFVSGAAASGVMDHTDALYVSGSAGPYNSGARSFYALIFNADTVAAATDYLVVGAFTADVPGSGMASFSNDITGMTSSGWSSISGGGSAGTPEPTSGLLLLVGAGLLGLRRKRA